MKKLKADLIFDGNKFLPANKVLICTEDGTIENILDAKEAGDDVQVLKGTLCPGWVNAHCHTELSHLKGKIPANKGIVDFVQTLMSIRDQGEEHQSLIKAGIDELSKNGIVAVGDICNTIDSIAEKKSSNIYFHNFIEVTGFVPEAALQRLEAAKQILQVFVNELQENHCGNSLAAHAPYSVSDRLFTMLSAATAGLVTTMHNQESAAENIFFEEKEGDFLKLYQSLGIDIDFFEPSFQSSIQSILGIFNARQKLLLVHNTFTSEKDLMYIKKYAAQFLTSVHFVLCPKANLYIENTLPDVALLRREQVNICIGTDSLASNNSLDILDELRTLHNANPSIPISELLQWGTLNGAAALDIDDIFGSFEIGKKPGVNLLEAVTEKGIGVGAKSVPLV